MHTQCREETKDIDHTFQMVGGQSSVHVKLVTSEVHMEKWVSLHSVHQMLPSHQTLANTHIYTHMMYHRKLTLVYRMDVAWEYEHSSVVRWSEEGGGLPQ